jgi:hypothetical protein
MTPYLTGISRFKIETVACLITALRELGVCFDTASQIG